MQLPYFMPTREQNSPVNFNHLEAHGGITVQGCNVFEWATCAAAVAGCAGLSGPALVACVAAVAPGCIKCVT
jgi:hypothetical protein